MLELQLDIHNLRILMGIMQDCIYVRTHNDIFRVLEILNEVIPFNSAILCRNNRESNVMCIDESVNHSYPAEWVKNYGENNFGLIDPVALISAKTTDPFTWKSAYNNIELTKDLKTFIGSAEDFGMKEGIACSSFATKGENIDTLMSLETSGHRVDDQYLAIVAYILPHIHEAVGRIDKVTQIPKDLPSFTLREKETLKWSYEGKTAWEIGVILSISERTVKFHLKNIYQKLNVTNRSQAVAKAIRYGIV